MVEAGVDWHDEVGDLRQLSIALRQDVLRSIVYSRGWTRIDLPVG